MNNNIEYIYKIFLNYFLEKIHKSRFLSINILIFLENLVARLRNKKVRFNLSKNKRLIKVSDSGLNLYYSKNLRSFWLYRNGISNRGSFLFKSYCLQKITFNINDIVFDCGANSGDLFLEISKYIPIKNYFAFEPNPSDFENLKINYRDAQLINKGLGKENSKLDFFVASEEADSSILEIENYSKKIEIDVIRLDDFLENFNIKKIKLLKLEAEGYEPEIILGAGTKLSRFEYIAVDGGYERGIKKEQTFTTVSNILIKNNFELVDIYFPWYRGLFRNTLK